MEEILQELGLLHLLSTFIENKIEPENVSKLSDVEFNALGVTTIGDRIRLKEKCRNKMEDADCDSPFVKRLKVFQSGRSRQKKSGLPNNSKTRETRKLYVGWKHRTLNGFQLIQSNKGGGIHHIDVVKVMDINALKQTIEDLFFPGGFNTSNSLHLKDLETHLATFSGEMIPDRLKQGDLFTVEGYCKQVASVPIRMYLHSDKTKSHATLPTAVGLSPVANEDEELPTMLFPTTPVVTLTVAPTQTHERCDEDVVLPVISTPTRENALRPRPTSQTSSSSGPPTPVVTLTVAPTQTHERCDEDVALPVISTPTRENALRPRPALESQTSSSSGPADNEPLPSTSGTPTVEFNLQRTYRSALSSEEELPDLSSHVGDPNWLDNGEEKNMFSVLAMLSTTIEHDRKNLVNVTRADVFPGALRAFKRPSFDVRRSLSVRFAGEEAIDDGGPSREFLRLLMSKITNYSIFTGPAGRKMIDMNYSVFQAGNYAVIGKMIAYSLVHRGPAPHFFSGLLLDIIVQDDTELRLDTDDIQDDEHKQLVQRLNRANNVSEFSEAIAAADHIINVAGCYQLAFFNKKEALCDAVTHFLVVGRLKQCLDQFRIGLETLGVLQALKNHPCLRECFLASQTELDTGMCEAIFAIPDLAEPGSNQRRKQELAISHWRDYLMDVAEGTEDISLRDVLIFGTGGDSVPYLGLDPQPQLFFKEPSSIMEDCSNFPTANTCANIITIPMLDDYERFKHNMNAAIGVGLFTAQ